MTNEEKQLLLKDLCARLPYGVKVKCGGEILTLNVNWLQMFQYHLDEIKPYLRSMSSMTEEEREDYKHIVGAIIYDEDNNLIIGFECNTFEQFVLLENWLNAHHFDYRGLIEKGLALEAHEEMYKTE